MKCIAHSKWFNTFTSSSGLSEYSVLVNIAAKELQTKSNTVIPRFRNDADKPRNDWWVEKVLHMPFDIIVAFENLVHHGGFLPVRFPFHALVTVVDGIALHIHLRGQGLAALCYDGSYLLDLEQVNL